MRITGYVLIGIGVVLLIYVGITFMGTEVAHVEQSGTMDAAPPRNGPFWVGLIPATLAILVGGWMAFSRDKGYKVTYDTTRQQS